MAWAELFLAFLVFFISHSVPVRPPVKPWIIARIGETGFTLVYAALSLTILAWLIAAAGRHHLSSFGLGRPGSLT